MTDEEAQRAREINKGFVDDQIEEDQQAPAMIKNAVRLKLGIVSGVMDKSISTRGVRNHPLRNNIVNHNKILGVK